MIVGGYFVITIELLRCSDFEEALTCCNEVAGY